MIQDRYTVEIFWIKEDNRFVAFVRELAGCSADGETRAEVVREVETAIELWIETARELGRPIPLPFSKNSEGDRLVRPTSPFPDQADIETQEHGTVRRSKNIDPLKIPCAYCGDSPPRYF